MSIEIVSVYNDISCVCCMPIKNPNTSVNLASRYTTEIGDAGGMLCR